MLDVTNVLRCGRIYGEPELEDDEWRYRVETAKFVLIVAIYREDREVRVITGWRKQT